MNKSKGEIEVTIPACTYPDANQPDAVKKTKEYGLSVAQAIQYEWFNAGQGNESLFYSRYDEFMKRRLYAKGMQPVDKYKKELAINGDLSYMNLDWKPVSVIPKFVDILVNGIGSRIFKPRAYSIDAVSQKNRVAYQDMIEGQSAAKDILSKVKKATGIDPFILPEDKIPENEEEVSLHMQMEYKPAIEVAEEEAIQTIFAENEYPDTRKRCEEALVIDGMTVAMHDFLPGAGVELRFKDAINVVHSYTEDPFMKDVYYWGDADIYPSSELTKYNPNITEEEIKEIAEASSAWGKKFGFQQRYGQNFFGTSQVVLLNFDFKTTKRIVHKKKILDSGGVRMVKKDDEFNPPKEKMEEGRFEKIEKTIEVWYCGTLVLGTNILLRWELMENMVRPASSSQHAISRYVGVMPRAHKGNIDSPVARMIPFADLIQINHLKMQQITQRMTPDGVFIDADGLAEIDLGNGQAYNPDAALKLYFQTGSVVGRSMTSEGEFNHGKVPIQEINHSSGGNKLKVLITNFNHLLNMLRTVSGLNEATDGSSPNPDSLVGLQKLASLSSNTATRHILDSSLFIMRRLAVAVSYRIADILEYAPFKEDFVNKIGTYNVSVLESIQDLYLYDFAIFIEVSPDEEEKAMLESNIQKALDKGDIALEDSIDIRQIQNIKIANQMLKLRKKKRAELLHAREIEKINAAGEQNQKAQMLSHQSKMEVLDAEANAKIKILVVQDKLGDAKVKREVMGKEYLMEKEFKYQMQLKGVVDKSKMDIDKAKEEAKDKRTEKQATQQSAMIEQRKNNLPAVTFESNEDSLDGFDLAEFEPR